MIFRITSMIQNCNASLLERLLSKIFAINLVKVISDENNETKAIQGRACLLQLVLERIRGVGIPARGMGRYF